MNYGTKPKLAIEKLIFSSPSYLEFRPNDCAL